MTWQETVISTAGGCVLIAIVIAVLFVCTVLIIADLKEQGLLP